MATAPEVLLKDLVEKMKCDDCGDYLRPPIFYIADNKVTSSCCEHKHSILGRIDLLESIGSALKFPCIYQRSGCKLTVTWEEAKQHNTECPFRQLGCPKCDWEGNSHEMMKHVKSKHSYINFNYKFSLTQNDGCQFVLRMDELYILCYKCEIAKNQLWFTIKYVGANDNPKYRHFKLTLKHKDNVYVERSRVEDSSDWFIYSDTSIMIDLRTLRMKLQMNDENVVELKVETYAWTPMYNGSVNESLLQVIECPVCHDYMRSPIFQCVVGHSVCSTCKPKLKTCPICQNNMGESRNYSLESICDQMYYKCMYADDGCSFTSPINDIIKHEKTCYYSYHDCPLKKFIGCDWRGKQHEQSGHFLQHNL